MKTFKADRLEVVVLADRAALGRAAAEAVCAAIGEGLERSEVANVMFAAAASQNEFLASLAGVDVEWGRVVGGHMDEYIGLAGDAPQGFGSFLRERLFGRVPMRAVHYMRDP